MRGPIPLVPLSRRVHVPIHICPGHPKGVDFWGQLYGELVPSRIEVQRGLAPMWVTTPHVGGHVPQIKGYMSPYMMLRQPLKGAD